MNLYYLASDEKKIKYAPGVSLTDVVRVDVDGTPPGMVDVLRAMPPTLNKIWFYKTRIDQAVMDALATLATLATVEEMHISRPDVPDPFTFPPQCTRVWIHMPPGPAMEHVLHAVQTSNILYFYLTVPDCGDKPIKLIARTIELSKLRVVQLNRLFDQDLSPLVAAAERCDVTDIHFSQYGMPSYDLRRTRKLVCFGPYDMRPIIVARRSITGKVLALMGAPDSHPIQQDGDRACLYRVMRLLAAL